MGRARSTCGEKKVHTGFWWESLREEDHLKDPGVRDDNIKMHLREVGKGTWTGSIWLRTC